FSYNSYFRIREYTCRDTSILHLGIFHPHYIYGSDLALPGCYMRKLVHTRYIAYRINVLFTGSHLIVNNNPFFVKNYTYVIKLLIIDLRPPANANKNFL